MRNYANGPEIPLGLGMALAQNIDAMNRFAAMTEEEKIQIIKSTHQINSKEEIRYFVQTIADKQ